MAGKGPQGKNHQAVGRLGCRRAVTSHRMTAGEHFHKVHPDFCSAQMEKELLLKYFMTWDHSLTMTVSFFFFFQSHVNIWGAGKERKFECMGDGGGTENMK